LGQAHSVGSNTKISRSTVHCCKTPLLPKFDSLRPFRASRFS
jgi:hypothetical protein